MAGVVAAAMVFASGAGRAQVLDHPHANFLFFRFASHTSLALYASYGDGNTLLVAGMIQNPRSGYHEIDGAIGRVVNVGASFSNVVAVGVVSASDSWYAPLYWLPVYTVGRLHLNGSLEYYEPLQHQGARQLDVNPLTAMVRTVGSLQVGAAYLLYTQVASVPTHEWGPAARLPVPNGTVQLEWLLRPRSGATDLRLTFQSN
jgi:hypothetical protein